MIITLCGSVRFKKETEQVAADLTFCGHVVLVVNVWGIEPKTGYIDDNNPAKKTLETIHFKKIDLSEAIGVMNVNGYTGKSTNQEIAYARKQNKQIFWYDILQAPLDINLYFNDLSLRTLGVDIPALR